MCRTYWIHQEPCPVLTLSKGEMVLSSYLLSMTENDSLALAVLAITVTCTISQLEAGCSVQQSTGSESCYSSIFITNCLLFMPAPHGNTRLIRVEGLLSEYGNFALPKGFHIIGMTNFES